MICEGSRGFARKNWNRIESLCSETCLIIGEEWPGVEHSKDAKGFLNKSLEPLAS